MNTTANFENKLRDIINEKNLIASGEHVLVALSGGVDSAAMLYALKHISSAENFTLSALHINHRLRGSAALGDEQKARRMCAALCVPFYCVRADVALYAKENKMSIELAGREVRYRELFSLKQDLQADKIATAHHLQDHIETLIMRCMRGSGVDGLKGIAIKRKDGIIRPLIGFEKKEIIQYARRQKIKYATDATNAQNDYLRNRVRNIFIARCKEADEDFEKIIVRLGASAQRLAAQIADEIEERKNMIRQQEGKISLPVEVFENTKPYLRPYLIRAMFDRAKALTDIEEKHIEQILQQEQQKTTWVLDMPGGLQFERCYENFQITKGIRGDETAKTYCFDVKKSGKTRIDALGIEISIEETEKFEKNSQSLYEKYIDYDKINGSLCLRNKRPQDRFYPLGMGGSKSIKKYFIDRKIPKVKRESTMMLCDEKEIVWVLGHEISEKYKIEPHTKNIIKIAVRQLR